MSNETQLSELLQQSLSPVNRGLNIPKPPDNFSFAPPPVPWPNQQMGAPATYNPNMNLFRPLTTKWENFQGQRALYGMYGRNVYSAARFSANMPQEADDPYMERLRAAEESNIRESTYASMHGFGGQGGATGAYNAYSTYKLAKTGVSLGKWALGIGAAVTAPFSLKGLAVGIGTHMALSYGASALDNTVFGGARDLRMQALRLRDSMNPQNIGFNMRDATGQIDNVKIQRLTNRLSTLRHEDASMSTEQIMKLTDQAARAGMLQNTSNENEIVERVRRLSKQLKVFAKVAGSKDIHEALERMAELKNMGVSEVHMNQVEANTATFARMAGISKDKMRAFGQQTASMAMQYGQSAASGYQYGQQALAAASNAQHMFTPNQLQRYGGAQGVATTMTQGMLASQQHVTNDMVLHSIFKSRGKGQFDIDYGALKDILGGRTDLKNVFNQRVADMRNKGTLTQHYQDFKERQGELQEALSSAVGPAGMQLLMLRRAQSLQKASGGKMTLFTALQNVTGNDDSARQIARIAQSPDVAKQMAEQLETEARRRQMQVGLGRERNAGLGKRLGAWFVRQTDWGLGRSISEFNARTAQIERDRAAGIYNRDHDLEGIAGFKGDEYKDYIRRLATGKGYNAYNVDTGINASTGATSFLRSPIQWIMRDNLQKQTAKIYEGYDFLGGGLVRNTMRAAWSGLGINQFNRTTGKIGLWWQGRGLEGSKAFKEHSDEVKERLWMGQNELSYKDSQESASLAGRIEQLYGGDAASRGNLGSSALALAEAREKFIKESGLDATTAQKLFRSANEETKKSFKKGWGSLRDSSFDAASVRLRMQKELMDNKDLTEEQRQQALRTIKSGTGTDVMATMVMTNLDASHDATRDYMLTRLRPDLLHSGGDPRKIKEAFLSNVRSSTGADSKTDTAHNYLRDHEIMQMSKMIMDTGAGSEGEFAFVAAVMQLHKEQTDGDGSLDTDKFASNLQDLIRKFKIPKDKASQLVRKASEQMRANKDLGDIRSFSGYKGLGSMSTTMAEELGKNVFKQRGALQATIADDNLKKRLEEHGIGSKSGESLRDVLKRASGDSTLIKGMLGAGGDKASLAKALQDFREAGTDDKKISATEKITSLLGGSIGITKTGVTQGGSPDAASKMQIIMARELHQFAVENQRNTAAFGQFVERISSGMIDFSKGAKDIKEAGEVLVKAGLMAQPKIKK